MAVPKLLYFDASGRAEAIRICLHAAGVEFEDERFPPNEWPERKATTPLGQVPTLTTSDGVTYCQSTALARYAAKLAGFYPDDPLEALKVDEMIGIIQDVMSSVPRSDDKEKMKELRKEWASTKLKAFADLMELRIQASGGKGTISVPSVADLFIMSIVEMMEKGFFDYVDSNFFQSYPSIKAAVKAIKENPKVTAYYGA